MSTLTATMQLIKPDVNDKKGQTISDLSTNFQYLDGLFPIGTIYESTKNVNPGTFRGGTWTPLEGRVLVGAGTVFPAGTTGGEKDHKLTNNEMPSNISFSGVNDDAPMLGEAGCYYPRIYQDRQANWTGNFKVSGGGTAHNNMPPYRAIYMWERTA